MRSRLSEFRSLPRGGDPKHNPSLGASFPLMALNVICGVTAIRLKSGAKRKWLARSQNVTDDPERSTAGSNSRSASEPVTRPSLIGDVVAEAPARDSACDTLTSSGAISSKELLVQRPRGPSLYVRIRQRYRASVMSSSAPATAPT